LALVACSGGSTTNVADIVTKVQQGCGFVTKWQDIAKVISTIVAGFNPDAGEKASVPIGIANMVIDAVCGALKNKAATQTSQQSITPTSATVAVNGVPVSGRMVDTSGK
jgi:hypothetical protein